MGYYCEVCDTLIKPQKKQNHFKSKTNREFDTRKQKKLTVGNLNINDVDKIYHSYIIEHIKKMVIIS